MQSYKEYYNHFQKLSCDFYIKQLFFFTVNICMADDTPTGKSLLKACEIAQKNGYNSTEGMLCVWYATPCDCHTDESIPAVCLPC